MTSTNPQFGFDELEASQAQPEVPVNVGFQTLSAAIAGEIVIDFESDADYELAASDPPESTDEWAYAVIRMTDTGNVLTAAREVIYPDVPARLRFMFVNETARALTIRGESTSAIGVQVAAGQSAFVRYDGEDVIAITTGGGGGGGGEVAAADVSFDPPTGLLVSDNVQDALEELAEAIDDIDSTGGGGGGGGINPATALQFFDDFIEVISNVSNGERTWATLESNCNVSRFGEADHPGVVRVAFTGTTNNQGGGFILKTGATSSAPADRGGIVLGSGSISIRSLVRASGSLPDGTNNYFAMVGLMAHAATSPSGVDDMIVAGLTYNGSAAVWRLESRNGSSTGTTADSVSATINLDQWYYLRLELIGAIGTAGLYVDEVKVAELTGLTFTSAALAPACYVWKSAGNANGKIFDWDFYDYRHTFASARF